MIETPSANVYICITFVEELMETAIARLRAKTDRELAVLIRREFDRTKIMAARGNYAEAAQSARLVRALLAVTNFPAHEREWIQCQLDKPITACA
jgi:hypothetical protein